MKSIAAAFGGLGLIVAACSNEPAAESAVSNFAAPGLAGLAVRDHPRGAQIISESPPIGQKDAVITDVNGTRVRDATHFRELIDQVYRNNEELQLGYSVGS